VFTRKQETSQFFDYLLLKNTRQKYKKIVHLLTEQYFLDTKGTESGSEKEQKVGQKRNRPPATSLRYGPILWLSLLYWTISSQTP